MCVNHAGGNTPSPQARSPRPQSDIDPSPDDKQEEETEHDTIGPKLEEDGGSAGLLEGDYDGNDPCRSEGIVHFVIRDFSKMTEQLLSEPVYIRNLPWSVIRMH